MMANRTTRKRDYEVGYGKPPEHSRFKKGQSGNPNGRPRKAKANNRGSWADIVFEECQREFTVKENGKEITLPIDILVIRKTLLDAANGVPGARRIALSLLDMARQSFSALDIPTQEEMAALGPHEMAAAYKRMMEAGS